MNSRAPYQVASTATPPPSCPLAAALQAVAERLQPLAASAGLLIFSLSTSRDYNDVTGWSETYCLGARPLDAGWAEGKGVWTVDRSTLAEAEAEFHRQLRAWQELTDEALPTH